MQAVAMHGDKSQSQRDRALARFEAGDIDTLVATDVASRGIDVPNVTHVINFDAPEDRDAYVHRVGRTGRAGCAGAGVSFVVDDQVADMRRIAARARPLRRVRPGPRPGLPGLRPAAPLTLAELAVALA
ncbi:MAG: C-terminal helicase domain-containing protein [Thermoleophilaceae bacterium]